MTGPKIFRTGLSGRGQTVIETILMLTILFVIFFMIAEFARAWYLKNSLNNAVRIAVRKAVVTPNLTAESGSCSSGGGGLIVSAVCSSPGVPGDEDTDTSVTVTWTDDDSSGDLNSGDTVRVSATAQFNTVVPNLPVVIFPDSASSAATMRYE